MPANKYSTGEPVNKKEINASIKDFKSEEGRVSAVTISTFLMDLGWDDTSVAAVISGVLDIDKDEKQMSYLRRSLARSGEIDIEIDSKPKKKKAAPKKAPAKKKAAPKKAPAKKAPAKKAAVKAKAAAKKKAPAKKKAAKPKAKSEKAADNDGTEGDIFD